MPPGRRKKIFAVERVSSCTLCHRCRLSVACGCLLPPRYPLLDEITGYCHGSDFEGTNTQTLTCLALAMRLIVTI